MINYLAKKMIHNYNELEDPAVRKAYGNLTSTVGIANNVILFLFKFLAGTLARQCVHNGRRCQQPFRCRKLCDFPAQL